MQFKDTDRTYITILTSSTSRVNNTLQKFQGIRKAVDNITDNTGWRLGTVLTASFL